VRETIARRRDKQIKWGGVVVRCYLIFNILASFGPESSENTIYLTTILIMIYCLMAGNSARKREMI